MEGGKKIMKKASDLPEEILCHHIFMKLDIEDVTPCKFVCKAWNRVIGDPEFAALHFKSNPHQYSTKLLMKDDRNVFYSADYNQAIASKTGLFNARKLNSVATMFSENAVLLGSKNGMVLLQISTNKLVLWNPTTRDFKLLCDIDPLIHPSDLFGLLYDITTDDYKIVRIGVTDNLRVYSLKEDLWRVGRMGIGYRIWYKPLENTNRCPIEVNGVLYWVVATSLKIMVLGFSLTHQKYFIFDLPVGIPCTSINDIYCGLAALGNSELTIYIFWDECHTFVAYTIKELDKPNPKWDNLTRLSVLEYDPKWDNLARLNVLEYDGGKLTKSIKPVSSYHGNLVLIITFKSSDKVYQKLVVYDPKRNVLFDREQRRFIYYPREKVFEEDISINGIVSIDDVIYTQTLVSPNDFGRKTPPGEQV